MPQIKPHPKQRTHRRPRARTLYHPPVVPVLDDVQSIRAAEAWAEDERWRQHIRDLWAVYRKYAPEPRGYDA